jgi:hypothetical protein
LLLNQLTNHPKVNQILSKLDELIKLISEIQEDLMYHEEDKQGSTAMPDDLKHATHYHHHEAGDNESSQGDSMFTNPALPVVTGAGIGNGYGYDCGFKPADAALVQSNNLAILSSNMTMGFQLLNNSVSQNSKENALIGKDNQIAILAMQSNMQTMFMAMQSKLDHIACGVAHCCPPPAPTRG